MSVVLTALWVPFLLRLRIQADGRSLLRPAHEAVQLQNRAEQEFAGSDFVAVVLEADTADALFAPVSLRWLYRFTKAVQAMPEVAPEGIRGMASDLTAVWTDAGLVVQPPVTQPVYTASEAAAVRAIVENEPLFRRVLIGANRRNMTIYVSVRTRVDRRRVFREIENLARSELADQPGYHLHFLGAVVAESMLAEYVLRDLLVLLPLASLVIGLILFLWFRELRMAALGLAEAAMAIVWTLGLMGALSRPVTLVGVLCPVILVAYCVSDTIYIAQRFREKRVQSPQQPRTAAMRQALVELARPLTFTSFTTCAGFLAFAASPVPPLRDFGLFTAYGVLFSLMLSLLVVPAALLLSGFGERSGTRAVPWIALRPLVRTASVVHHPRAVIAVCVALTVIFTAGATRLRVQDSWLRNFNSSSALRSTDAWFNQQYMGSNILNVVIRTGRDQGALEPQFLMGIRQLQFGLKQTLGVGGSISVDDCLRVASRSVERRERTPASMREAAEWSMVYASGDSGRTLGAYLNQDGSAANLWVFLNHADYAGTKTAMDAVNRLARVGPLKSADISFAGDAYLGYALVDEIARSLLLTLSISLVLVFLVVWVLMRSASRAAVVTLPVTCSVLWNFGFLGWAGIPIGVATSTFSSIALGIGIDFAIQWTARLEALRSQACDWEAAVLACQTSTGSAIVLHSAVMVAGFGLLAASAVPPNRSLGLLVCVNLVVCALVTLCVLPAVGTLWSSGKRCLTAA